MAKIQLGKETWGWALAHGKKRGRRPKPSNINDRWGRWQHAQSLMQFVHSQLRSTVTHQCLLTKLCDPRPAATALIFTHLFLVSSLISLKLLHQHKVFHLFFPPNNAIEALRFVAVKLGC